MGAFSRILQFFHGNKTHQKTNDWYLPERDDKGQSPDKGLSGDEEESILFFIDCPCSCGRAIRLALPSEKPDINYDIPKIGNKFWQQLVSENGLEGAIEFLHENA